MSEEGTKAKTGNSVLAFKVRTLHFQESFDLLGIMQKYLIRQQLFFRNEIKKESEANINHVLNKQYLHYY